MNIKQQFKEGLITNNPVLVQLIGMCATMAITTSLFNGIGMGLSVLVILTCCNVVISLIRKVIPNDIRLAIFVLVIAGFVTIVDLLLQAYVPALSASLGVFIPLIVVNCIILGRAESYASKNPVLPSIFDGLGMGLGFTVGLLAIGAVREIIGAGQIFGKQILPLADSTMGKAGYTPITIFILAPGAFLVLAGLAAIQNKVKINMEKKGKDASKIQSGCGSDCATCAGCASTADKGKE